MKNSLYKSDTILLKTDGSQLHGFVSYEGYFLELKSYNTGTFKGIDLICHEHISNYDKGTNHEGKLILFDF